MADVDLPTFVLLPGASFLMGTPEAELSALAKAYGGTRESYREESPQHEVAVSPVAIAQTPVSNRLYAAFVATGEVPAPLAWHGPQPPAELAPLPVCEVSWHDAWAFCAWLNATVRQWPVRTIDGPSQPRSLRVRLPDEAEWEYAARGHDGRRFPWGNEYSPAQINSREDGRGLLPASALPSGASPFGLLAMAGGVWEWTASLDRLYPFVATDGRNERHAEGRRILRGGCYANPHGYARCACRFRMPPQTRSPFVGLRLAADLAE